MLVVGAFAAVMWMIFFRLSGRGGGAVVIVINGGLSFRCRGIILWRFSRARTGGEQRKCA